MSRVWTRGYISLKEKQSEKQTPPIHRSENHNITWRFFFFFFKSLWQRLRPNAFLPGPMAVILLRRVTIYYNQCTPKHNLTKSRTKCDSKFCQTPAQLRRQTVGSEWALAHLENSPPSLNGPPLNFNKLNSDLGGVIIRIRTGNFFLRLS